MHAVVEDAALVDLGNGETLESLGFLSEWRMMIGFCLDHGGFPVPPDTDPDDETVWERIGCPSCDAAGIPRSEQTWFLHGGTLDGTEPLWDGGTIILYDGTEVAIPAFDAETGVLWVDLHDLKTMQEYAIGYMVKGDDKNLLHPQVKDGYVWQANVYKYLGEKSVPPEALRRLGVKQIRFAQSQIQAFAMGEAPFTGSTTYRWKDHYSNPLKDWPMYPIQFFGEPGVEAYIRERGKPIYRSLILNETRGEVCEPDPAKNGAHSWMCNYCAFHGSDFCPNPGLEFMLIEAGTDPEQAFQRALQQPVEIPEDRVAPVESYDNPHVQRFLAAARGEEFVQIEKPKKPRAKRAS